MITIKTLEGINTDEIVNAFNESFSDYIIPLSLTREQFQSKIKNDSIHLELSAGAFEGNKLIGFILHGYDSTNNRGIVYNAGTGVIPSQRGRRLTAKLYEYISPLLQSKNIDKIQLEVITGNTAAIKTYQTIGFKRARTLNCYKGPITIAATTTGMKVIALDFYDWTKLRSFWDWQPTWQNAVTAAENMKQENLSFGIYLDEKIAGYVIFNPANKRVQQFAVDKTNRHKGIGSQLFYHIAVNFEKNISIINVEESSEASINFLMSIGLKCYVKQDEMVLEL